VDVAIVGAGPGGLALALGLQTVAPELKVKVSGAEFLAVRTVSNRLLPARLSKHCCVCRSMKKQRSCTRLEHA